MCRLDEPYDTGFDDPHLTKIGLGLILAALIVTALVLFWSLR